MADPSLTVECKNSMLEPIRRVIDSALPTKVKEFELAPPPQPIPFLGAKTQEDLRLEALLHQSNQDIQNWSRSHPSQVTLSSPENPLQGLTQEEYYAFKYVFYECAQVYVPH